MPETPNGNGTATTPPRNRETMAPNNRTHEQQPVPPLPLQTGSSSCQTSPKRAEESHSGYP
eukprot:3746954-Alexandrium_andersonii.AAC.1